MTMLSLKEISLLNLIIDGQEIFALPSIQNIKITPLVAENIYASLVEKCILVSSTELTKKGANIVKCMADYKSAERYVKIGYVIIGICKEKQRIALTVNPLENKYYFSRIEITPDIDALSKQYPFLLLENTQKSISIQATSYEELKEMGLLKYDNSILISSFDKIIADKDLNKAIRNIVLFYHNGNHYIYDCDTNTVTPSSRKASISILAESLVAK